MEHVDIAHNPEIVDVLSSTGRQQPQQRPELSDLETRHHQFSLISPAAGPELTLNQTYIGLGHPTGATVNSADDSFRITGNGIWAVMAF